MNYENIVHIIRMISSGTVDMNYDPIMMSSLEHPRDFAHPDIRRQSHCQSIPCALCTDGL